MVFYTTHRLDVELPDVKVVPVSEGTSPVCSHDGKHQRHHVLQNTVMCKPNRDRDRSIVMKWVLQKHAISHERAAMCEKDRKRMSRAETVLERQVWK